MDIVALGELLIDFASVSADEEGYPTLAAHPGGAPANFLASAAKYGAETAMIGKVGNDAFGRLLTGTLEKNGIGTDGIVVDDSVFTTLAFVTFDEQGDRSFSFARKPGADTCLKGDEINCRLIDEAEVFHFGSLSLTSEPARQATYGALEYAKKAGKLISFDPNLREPLWDNPDEAREQILKAMRYADVVKISDYEVDFLWGVEPRDAGKKLFFDYYVSLIHVTCGEKGCICSNGRNTVITPALDGVKVLDTTGAGDIYGGAAMARMLQKGKTPGALQWEELKDISEFACTAAGLSTERPGGISSVPSYDEVLARMKKEYSDW